jgi:hypothetical protein
LNSKADCTVGLFENYEEGRLEQPKEVFVGRWVGFIRSSHGNSFLFNQGM